MSGATKYVVRHKLNWKEPLALSNYEAWALVSVCKAVGGLKEEELLRLSGDAMPEERAELLSAFAQLGAFLAREGWTP